MRYFYDTEFLEDGRTIELISIGIVAEDGREYYAASYEMPIGRIREHEWLMANVVPHLPPHPRWKPKDKIRDEVQEFLLADGKPELWAWYGAYDHVALAQLFGPMIELPEGIPMWTNDLRQEVHRLGNPSLPEQPDGQHDALADARWLRHRFDYVQQLGA